MARHDVFISSFLLEHITKQSNISQLLLIKGVECCQLYNMFYGDVHGYSDINLKKRKKKTE